MIYSRYNYLYKSKRFENYFIYNSRSNAFLSLSEDLYLFLKNIQYDEFIDTDHLEINKDIMESMIRAKIIVEPWEDDNFILQKELVKRAKSFQDNRLGVVIIPTYACNFKCPYCYEANLPYDYMSESVEDGVIDFFKSYENCNNLSLCWHGGEPLIAFENIKSLLTKIEKDNKIKMTSHALVTNGYLLDVEKCLFFNDHQLKQIQVTVDGLKENHDKSRVHKSGASTFHAILNNVENVFKLIPECRVVIRINIHAENELDYPQLYKYLKSRWGNENFCIDLKYAKSHNDNCNVECLNEKDKIFYLKKLYTEHNFTNFKLYPKSKIGGCTATNLNSYVIGPNGDLYKCWVDVGKQDRKIGDIFSRKFNSGLISEYVLGTDMFTDSKCLKCLLLPVCDGGCNLCRLNKKMNDVSYDLCPIDVDNLDTLFDFFYERQMEL